MFEWILGRAKVIVIMLTLLVLVGIITVVQLPKREIPEVSVNIATVKTVFPGASPEEVERNITNPLEEELKDIDGLKEISSVSATGFSNIVLEFEDSFNENDAFSQLRQSVSDVSRTFPDDSQEPEVNTDLRPSAVASYHLMSSDPSWLLDIRDQLEAWEEKMLEIDGIAKVQVKGLPEQEVLITLNADQLQAYNVVMPQVMQAINKEFSPAALGKAERQGTAYQLKIRNYDQVSEIENVTITKGKYNQPVYVKDVGSVEIVPKEKQDLITYRETPSLSVTVLAEKGVNILPLQEKISAEMKQLQKELPQQIEVEPFYLQSTFVEDIFRDLAISSVISVGVVILVMLLGLTPSSAFLVALAIPLSILIGIIPLPYAEVDLNQITIIGMIIAIGILVDDAIVVNDNIQRRYRLGDGPKQGAVNGVKEVWISIVTSSLMIIFSFFPLVFLSGSSGAFIRALPTVLITTIIGSTIIALTFIPIYTSWREKKNQRKERQVKRGGLLGGFFAWLERFYADKVLAKIVKRPVIVGLSGLVACILLSSLATKIPFEFFPAADREEVTVSVRLPNGTLLEDTEDTLKEIEDTLQQDELVKETAVFAGTGLPGLFSAQLDNPGENTGQVLVRIDKEETSTTNFMNKWDDKLREQYSNAVIELETIVTGPPVGAPVAVKVAGPDIDYLIDLADSLQFQLENLEGAKFVTVDVGTPQPVVEYVPDRTMLDWNGLTIQDVSQQIQAAVEGVRMGTFDDGNERRDMRLFLDDNVDSETVDLRQLELRSQYQQEGALQTVSVDELVDEVKKKQLQRIPHIDGERTITIRAYPEEGEKAAFEEEALSIVNELKGKTQEGYSLTIGGETSERSEFFIEVTKLFIIVLFLIYLVIVIQFNSLLMPFLILSSVYLGITGAIIGLFITGTPLSFLAVLGMVSLSGIVVRNSVILIEFIQQRMDEGMSMIEAVIEAGRARIRPIVLTTLTSIGALLPIAIAGDVLFRPLAIAVVAGLAFSTGLTLLLVPAFYLILAKFSRTKTKAIEE
ncbi:efflux RND transporter permease subunit [Bacillus tianshenii]|nr:efflux RND transporter permease subunit [Bacillus tianshenii]